MKVFIQHVPKDQEWADRFRERLEAENVTCWTSNDLGPDAPWPDAFESELKSTGLVLMLLSADFFASAQRERELYLLRQYRESAQQRWLPVLLRACPWQAMDWLENVQILPEDHQPLRTSSDNQNKRLTETLNVVLQSSLWMQKRPAPAASGRFRVLLLSTEQDLGNAQEKVANYLVQLGMEVSTSLESMPASTYDQVVLIQAWRWEEGQAISIWERVSPEKRCLFLIRETSDWPMKYMELSAIFEIQNFRTQHPDALTFEAVTELPAQVGQYLDGLRRTRSPASTFEEGLSEVERTYLQLNLPAWLSGRRYKARSSLYFGYETHRIYSSNNYVLMDGQSQRFGRNARGEIVLLDGERGLPELSKEQIDNSAKEKLVNRLPLTAWVAARPLGNLVVTGSPGIGKTVFLTRVAAELAAHLLGENIATDPLLEGLYSKPGPDPIPVVLDAPFLAMQEMGLSGLANALRDVFAIAGTDNLPSISVLERQLRKGRFLLLVDALDEIGPEPQQRRLLDFLKAMASLCPAGRLVLTTRSARYVGFMPFAPEFEMVEVMPFDQRQVAQFCHQYRIAQGALPEFELEVLQAINHLYQGLEAENDSFSGNGLMLTTLCWLYQRDRRFPDYRVSLCSRMVDSLCEARSQPGPDGKLLRSDEKRNLLARLALAMQREGRQSYPHSSCLAVIAAALPSRPERTYHERLLHRLVSQTGLMYYQDSETGEETLRFSHRLFREYLAALDLLAADRTMERLVADLASDGHLIDPFWFDVIRMLPGVANSSEKAEFFAAALRSHARAGGITQARLWGTLAATLQENPHLYPGFDIAGFTTEALGCYAAEGHQWSRDARFLLLEGIGKLGDPRLDWRREDYWVYFGAGCTSAEETMLVGQDEGQIMVVEPFFLARFPVTVGEFQRFIEDDGYRNPEHWSEQGWNWVKSKNLQVPIHAQRIYYSNEPKQGVSFYEAEAYCAWLRLSSLEGAECMPCLPSEVQWEYAARGTAGRPNPWGAAAPTIDHANFNDHVGRTTPVGAYPQGNTPEGVSDMAGNVWEWCTRDGAHSGYVLRGGSWSSGSVELSSGFRKQNETDDTATCGFRLARVILPKTWK